MEIKSKIYFYYKDRMNKVNSGKWNNKCKQKLNLEYSPQLIFSVFEIAFHRITICTFNKAKIFFKNEGLILTVQQVIQATNYMTFKKKQGYKYAQKNYN